MATVSSLDAEVTDADVSELAKFMTQWEDMRTPLGLNRAKQREIESIRGYGKQKVELVEEWKEAAGKGATYGTFIKAARGAKLNGLADKVEAMLRERVVEEPPSPEPAEPEPETASANVLPEPEKPFLLHDKRGLAILVTCDYQGTANSPLNATNNDANEMRKTFEQFRYDIHQLQNGAATERNITTLLKQASHYLSQYPGSIQNSDGSPKVIVFAFSGHGTSCGYDDDQIITFDNKKLFLKEQIRLPLVKHSAVTAIPKLFFMDACRGSDNLRQKTVGKGNTNVEANYRMDYATIPNHTSRAGPYESVWMPVLADFLRRENRELSVVVEMVNGKVCHGQAIDALQQPESVNRLRLEVPLNIYYNPAAALPPPYYPPGGYPQPAYPTQPGAYPPSALYPPQY